MKKFIFLSIFILLLNYSFSQCIISQLNVNIGACSPSTNDYSVTGTVKFSNEPSTGQLIVKDIYSGAFQSFNFPFASPTNFSITGLNSNMQNSTIKAYFTADTSCNLSLNYTAPISCGCNSYAGTFSTSINGQGTNLNVLCDGDELNVVSNNDFILPVAISPGVGFLVYTCAPNSLNNDPFGDACMFTIYSSQNNFTELNQGGAAGGTLNAIISGGGTVTNNTLWFVPITFTDNVNYSFDPNCVDLGEGIEVTYLNPLQISEVVDGPGGTVTVTITGGYTEFFSGNYTITNNGSGNLSSTTVGNSGGSFVISNLNSLDNYNYDVIDDNGCAINGSGTMPNLTGIREEDYSFSVFPNPAHNYLQIETKQKIISITLFDISGREVGSNLRLQNNSVDISFLPLGSYFVQLNFESHPSNSYLFIKN